MKKTVFFAGCAIALAGQAHALAQVQNQPYAMSFAEFQSVGEVAGWVVPSIDGAVVAPIDELARRGRGTDDAPGDDHGNHGAGHALNGTLGAPWMQLARNGADDAGGDDNSGSGGGDDNSGSGGDDDDDDSDEDGSGSGRESPRVPGGSGCDDAGDAQEHAECAG